MLHYHISRCVLSKEYISPSYYPDTPVKALLIGQDMDTAINLWPVKEATKKAISIWTPALIIFIISLHPMQGKPCYGYSARHNLYFHFEGFCSLTCSRPVQIIVWNMMLPVMVFRFSSHLTLTYYEFPDSVLPSLFMNCTEAWLCEQWTHCSIET